MHTATLEHLSQELACNVLLKQRELLERLHCDFAIDWYVSNFCVFLEKGTFHCKITY